MKSPWKHPWLNGLLHRHQIPGLFGNATCVPGQDNSTRRWSCGNRQRDAAFGTRGDWQRAHRDQKTADWEVVLVAGVTGKLWEMLAGHPTRELLGQGGRGSHPERWPTGRQAWGHSLQTGTGAQRATGDNNKRGCCTGRHAAWPMKERFHGSGSMSAAPTERTRTREQRQASMSDGEDSTSG